ncbi:Conserved_hypothetical protein [Hexamita inflata]|uniref:Uncharacterized protein n=1 Tax=Hexamita inflata TaxID=28002 RepID=A0ABP1JHE3_9EUKA
MDEIIAINMLTDKVKKFSDVYGKQKAKEITRRINSSRTNQQISNSFEIHIAEIQQLFCLGECGLQLRVEIQKQIFGEEFPEKCRVEFEKYMKSQMTETYINETIALIKPVREDWKALEEKYTGMAMVEEKEKYLHDCQLLNVMKLAPNLDVYMAVEDGFIHIIDKDRKILHQIEVDYDYYVGKQFSNTDQKQISQSLVHNYVNNITFFNGSMYVQAFNKVYRIHNMKTELAGTIPYLNLDYFKAYPQSVGSDSQHLIVYSDLQRQYILNNNKFKFNKYISLQYFSFCGYSCNWGEQSIVFSKFGQVLEYDNTYFQIKHVSKISFCSSGILVINTENYEIVYVLNIVTQQIQKLYNDLRFSKRNIGDNIELGIAGIQLKQQIIVELFGKDSILQIEQAFKNYYEMNTSQYPQLERELTSFVSFAKDHMSPQFKMNIKISQCQNNKPKYNRYILQKCQLMNVVKLKSNYDIYMAIEDNHIYIFDEKRRLIGKYQVDYNMYAGIYKEKQYQKGHNISYACQYNVTICDGEIYVRRFESVYKVHNNKLLFQANIPYQTENEMLKSILFSYDNKLYAICNRIIYKLTYYNGSYTFCDANDNNMYRKQYFQFCDKFLVIDDHTYQMYVEGNQKLQTFVYSISGYCLESVINLGGILIFKTFATQNQKIYYFVNLISGQIEAVDSQDLLLNEYQLLESIELGGSGLQINDEVINWIFNQRDIEDESLNKLIDKQPNRSISENANEEYKSYLIDLEHNSKNWNEQINKLLSIDIMVNYFTDYEEEKFEQINSSFSKVQEKVLSKLNQVKQKVAEVTNKYNEIIVRFAENYRTESTQQ